MYTFNNDRFSANFNQYGRMTHLHIDGDVSKMNWLVDESYLNEHGYDDFDKLFGMFTLQVDGRKYTNDDTEPDVHVDDEAVHVRYPFTNVSVTYVFSFADNETVRWDMTLQNTGNHSVQVESFAVWTSLAYMMFRDTNVLRNMQHSAAIFPSISDHCSKIAAVKRDGKGPNLGLYSEQGRVLSIGSYCRYTNRFREQVSPSLDGCIYHQCMLAGNAAFKQANDHDWIYEDFYEDETVVRPNEKSTWTFVFSAFDGPSGFYENGLRFGHPIIDYAPTTICDGRFHASITVPTGETIQRVWFEQYDAATEQRSMNDVRDRLCWDTDQQCTIDVTFADPGERKLIIELSNGKRDFVVFNVYEPLQHILESRADYLCRHSYIDAQGDGMQADDVHGFVPISNQGESLGKCCFILKKNIVGDKKMDQIHKVENSAYFYIRNKWFVEGDFQRPRKLYGDFYRIFDLDYAAHVYYLLSCFEEEDLQHASPQTYLQWAAQLLIVRFDEMLHDDEREKKETRLNGVFNLYIEQLLQALVNNQLKEPYERLHALWTAFCAEVRQQSDTYQAAITEHYYDNAGFAPACITLCINGDVSKAEKYGKLILANIGFSNDYRNQNPDRWWEALAYMMHSLWGGLASHAALVTYEHVHDTDYLLAAYRSMMPIFYCYDWHAQSSKTRLAKGEAASTYCVTNPNMNKPHLSHNRFGQSEFLEDDPELFAGATGDDWDMGEELAAYLDGFGTKTYLYEDENGVLRCVNGHIERITSDGQDERNNQNEQGEKKNVQNGNHRYVVTSYAPYPKHVYFFDKHMHVQAKRGEYLPQVVLCQDNEGNISVENDETFRS